MASEARTPISGLSPVLKPSDLPIRLYHLDNLRTALTALVILHHTGIPYGGLGSWPYRSRFHSEGSSPSLVVFNAVNQTFFMGSFFYLSGMMSSMSVRRRGPTAFLKSKLTKLGIPVLVYTLLAPALQTCLQRLSEREVVTWDVLKTHLRGLRGVKGPVWYAAVLLVFDILYTVLPRIPSLSFGPTMLLNVASTFLIRIWYPAGMATAPLNLQPGYLPQYIVSYTLGARSSVPTPVSPSLVNRLQKRVLLGVSVASGLSIVSLLRWHPLASMRGGWNWLAFSYAVWNESTGLLIGSTALDAFRGSSWGTKKWRNLGKYSYGAFLVHQPVCVAMQCIMDKWPASSVSKTVVIGIPAIVASWIAGWALTLLPGVEKIIL
ncbi:acyltransferase 3 [Cadophora sp. MPI-SDFR-AT-0126]|nr:acyltransferase 3 [Leotiomycetes sp. MPI-SDFR-AT-0126]